MLKKISPLYFSWLLTGALIYTGTVYANQPEVKGENIPAFPPAEIPPWVLYQAGVAYLNGDGVLQNIEQGRYWIHQAARQGIPLAQYNLGVMFYDGIGGERNPGCALWWLQRAHNQQQDGDVQLMAEQALAALASEARSQPKIYRTSVLPDCDRLPALYIADTGMTKAAADTGPRTETFSRQRNTVVSLVQRFRDSVTVFKEKSLFVIRKALSADMREELPGMVAGKHSASYFPAEVPEISKPELSENIIRMDSPQEKAVLPPRVSGEPAHEDVVSATEPLTTVLPAPLQEPLQQEVTAQNVHSQKEQTSGGDPGSSPDKQSGKSRVSAPRKNAGSGGDLRTASKEHYTLQLASAAAPGGLYASARSARLKNYLVYKTVRHNQDWYVLVAGEYPTKFAARQAMNELPVIFRKNAPWIRSLRQVQSELTL